MTTADFRNVTEAERTVLGRMLAQSFPGRDEVAAQLSGCRVRTLDLDGSIEFEELPHAKAPVATRIPVEAEAPDSDGVPIYFLLHVVNGRVKELEVYKADGSPIIRLPLPEELDVIVLGE